ncbi:MAG: hypothetical protein J6V04_02085 [Bacteroidales bacterium]|nr:hypothetical protein [Bacteroidales bacterium]
MKKYFLSIVALAGMLFATSCQESLVEPQEVGTTTFTVQLPDGMGTKAYGDEASTQATINRLYVEVYSNDGNTLVYEPSVITMNNATATVTLNLVSTQEYDIIFWAQNEFCTYDVTDLRSVKMNANHHNSETGAAFYAVLNDYKPVNGQQGVTLTRPFAQLNLGTTNEVSYANGTNKEVKILSSRITVTGVAENFNRVIDANHGEGVDSTTFKYQYNYRIPEGTITVNNIDYQYVSMDYLAVPANQALVNVTAVIDVEDPNGVQSTITRQINDVPVQLNYRTNIVGNLITSATDFIVVVEEEWKSPDESIVFRQVSTAAELQDAIEDGVDNITLVDDIELDQPLVFGIPSPSPIARASADATSFVLDLNNKTLEGSIQVYGGVALTINNGIIRSENPDYSGIESVGNLTLNNVAISSNRHAVRIEAGYAVINGGNYTLIPYANRTQHALNVSGESNVIVKNGSFIGPKGKQSDSGSAVNVQKGSTVTIECGDFSGGKEKTLACNADGFLYVKGGVFDQNPEQFVVEGYEVVSENNLYKVKKSPIVGDIVELAGQKAVIFSVNKDEIKAVSVAELNLKGKTWQNAMDWAEGLGEGWNLASMEDLNAIYELRCELNDVLEADNAENALFWEGDVYYKLNGNAYYALYMSSTEVPVGEADANGNEYFENRVFFKIFNNLGYSDVLYSAFDCINKNAPLRDNYFARGVYTIER